MNCREYETRLSALLDGELPEEERAGTEGHLESCPACRAYFEDLRAIRAALGREDAPVPEGFAERVMERVRETPQAGRKRLLRWGRRAALAACCAVAALGLWGLQARGFWRADAVAGGAEFAAVDRDAAAPAGEPEEGAEAGAALLSDVEVPLPGPEEDGAWNQAPAPCAAPADSGQKEAANARAETFVWYACAPASDATPAQASGKPEPRSGTAAAGGPAARVWAEAMGLEWEAGRTCPLTEEEFAGLLETLALAGEDYALEPGEGWALRMERGTALPVKRSHGNMNF